LIFGHPALRLLARRKFTGVLRRQGRKLKTPSGILFTLLGAIMFVIWITSIFASHWFSKFAPKNTTPQLPLELVPAAVGVGCLVLSLASCASALSFRGLYLPKEEIELLFSAPVSRGDVVRYRMLTNLGKSLFGSFLIGAVVAMRMPRPLFAFSATAIGFLTQPALTQMLSLLAGDAENRALSKLPRGLGKFLGGVFGALVGLLIASVMIRGVIDLERSFGFESNLEATLRQPWVPIVTAPFTPWVRAITAQTWSQFLPWFGICIALWFLFFEAAARVRVDFRELSLETSADVARRLNRMRQGAIGAAGSTAVRSKFGWSVPWWLGRGPAGAVAWRKTTTILRKARGTFVTSAIILTFVTILVSMVMSKGERSPNPLSAAVAIGVAGTLYLCMGLRFDFREDLQLMEQIKAWPIAPWRVFLATILPEVLLVWFLCSSAVLIRGAITSQLTLHVFFVIGAMPLLTFTWLSVDNAVFLLAPIRYVAGQDTALQNAGRSVVLLLVRMVLLGLTGLFVAAGYLCAELVGQWLEWEDTTRITVGVLTTFVVLAAINVVVASVGGHLVRRFDVARDRG